jgi:DNA-binding GntR family transcriptional regulator
MSASLSQKAYEAIKNDIITCVLMPGEQISQSQLAEKYDRGTTPVREALRRLVQEGFVEVIPRFGYIVKPITFRDVHEMFELRMILESSAVRLAAARGLQEQLQKIAANADFTYVYRDRASYSKFLGLNAEFHRSIAVVAGNQRLVDLLSKLLDELTRVFHLGLHLRDSAEEMRDEHLALSEALLKRDSDRAEQSVRSQIARSQERVLEALVHRTVDTPYAGLDRVIQLPTLHR